MLAWFSKPEEAMNKRLNNRIAEDNQQKEEMLDQVSQLKTICNKYIDEIGVKLKQCLQIFGQNQSLEDIQKQIKEFQHHILKEERRQEIKLKL